MSFLRSAMIAALTLLCGLLEAADPEAVLWRDPGRVEAIDFRLGACRQGKAPKPPFTFIREEKGGTSPKVTILDAAGAEWRVKGGLEVRSETFVTRFVSALGYYADCTYFIAEGKFEGVGKLKRASGFVKEDGSFTYAAFERREKNAKFVKGPGWRWDDNPFQRTPQLNGLRILVILFSNWDNKTLETHTRAATRAFWRCVKASDCGISISSMIGARRWASGVVFSAGHYGIAQSSPSKRQSLLKRGRTARYGLLIAVSIAMTSSPP
ncbi:MAG: hypothetical protein WKF37_02345 [Bryobacteraceae bacterium]